MASLFLPAPCCAARGTASAQPSAQPAHSRGSVPPTHQLRGCFGARKLAARVSGRVTAQCQRQGGPRTRQHVTRAEIGGEYLDNYADVDRTLLNYVTYRALRMSLQQLLETDTTAGKQEYTWLYNFAVNNPPSDSVTFLRALLNEREDMGQRLMEQRLVIFQRWYKGFKASDFNDQIQESNKELLLETMMKRVNMSLEAEDRA
jgi:RbcX protein